MSRTRSATLPCPSCAASVEVEAYASVNGGRHPELRQEVIDGTLQCHTCACGAGLRVAPEFSYLDVERQEWLAVHPWDEVGDWPEHEAHAQTLFDQAFSSGAALELRAGISPRVVFGWSALREKLIARQHELDDVVLECVKLAVMRQEGIVPQTGQEMRLIAVHDAETLDISIIDARSETVVQGLGVPRALYAEIAAKPDDWAPIREKLTAGCFVDAQRMYLREG